MNADSVQKLQTDMQDARLHLRRDTSRLAKALRALFRELERLSEALEIGPAEAIDVRLVGDVQMLARVAERVVDRVVTSLSTQGRDDSAAHSGTHMPDHSTPAAFEEVIGWES